MAKIHTVEVDGRMCHINAGTADVKVKFEYRETHPMEVGIYIILPAKGIAVFNRCARSVLLDGLYRDVYPLVGDLRTRTDVNDSLDKFAYFIFLRNETDEASIGIHDHLAVEEFISSIYEAVAEEDEVPGAGWENALERLLDHESTS